MDPTFYLYRKYKNNISNYQYYITLAKSIANRLKKYEFHVWIDFEDIRPSDLFQDQITNALLNAVNNGYVITLLNDQILNSNSWVRAEVITALHKGIHPEKGIIPIIKDSLLWNK